MAALARHWMLVSAKRRNEAVFRWQLVADPQVSIGDLAGEDRFDA